MNFKEKLNQIRALLSIEVKLETAQLTDGATVEAEQFAPEFPINIVTENGNIPLPVGTYETQDGYIIVVEVEGVIATYNEKPSEEEVEEVEAQSEPAPVQNPTKVVESVTKEQYFEIIEQLTKENEALKIELASLKEPDTNVQFNTEPINYNPEASKTVELQKFGKPSTIKENIYKELFN